MFDIGFWELVLISVVALVVLGPERLPHAIRSVARFVSSAKAMANSVKEELNQELKIQELQESLRKAEQLGMKNLSPELQDAVDQLKQAAQEVQRPYAQSPTNADLEQLSVTAESKTESVEPIAAESVAEHVSSPPKT